MHIRENNDFWVNVNNAASPLNAFLKDGLKKRQTQSFYNSNSTGVEKENVNCRLSVTGSPILKFKFCLRLSL